VARSDVLGKLIHHAFAPRGRFQFAADVLTDLPIEFDERCIDSLVRLVASLFDEANDLTKRPFVGDDGRSRRFDFLVRLGICFDGLMRLPS
jgi:hypothetical protein